MNWVQIKNKAKGSIMFGKFYWLAYIGWTNSSVFSLVHVATYFPKTGLSCFET